MGMWFKNKNRESKKSKETNIAYTPEDEEPKKYHMSKKDIFFLVWTILSMALYSSYTFFVVYRLAEETFLADVIFYLLLAYCVVFILLVILSIRNRRKLKSRLKTFKSATKFLKYIMKIISLTLSIVTTISAFVTTGRTDFFVLIYGILSLVMTIIFILIEIVSLIIRKNIPVIKRNLISMRDKREPKQNQDDENY